MSIPTWGGPEPQYQQQPPAPKQSNTALIVVSTVAVMLALALVGLVAYYFLSSGKQSEGTAAMTSMSVEGAPTAASKSTVTTTVDAPAPNQPGKANASAKCDYSTWDVTDPEVTTPGFAQNVYSDFKAACRDEGTPNVTLVDVYSPRTQKYYTMTCRDRGDQVVCTGGRNAAVYIS